MKLIFRFTLLVLLFNCSADSVLDNYNPDSPSFKEIWFSYKARDYFKLMRLQESLAEETSFESQLLSSVIEYAFNKPEESNLSIDNILKNVVLPDSIRIELLRMKLINQRRLYMYGDSYRSASQILSGFDLPEYSSMIRDIKNVSKLLSVLADVPPQSISKNSDTHLRMNNGFFPVRIGSHNKSLGIDTGANFSLFMRSEAESLGLEILNVELEVRTATDLVVTADVTVVPRMAIGNVDLQNIVFLVFDDDFLTFPGGFRIPGLIGFPVVEALGEIRFFKNATLEIPAVAGPGFKSNLAIEDSDILICVEHGRDSLIGRFDTGASETVFYEPFFRKYKSKIEGLNTQFMAKAGGVGGFRDIPAYEISDIELEIGDKAVFLKEADIYTKIITNENDNILFLNVGTDILYQYNEFTINFISMSIRLN